MEKDFKRVVLPVISGEDGSGDFFVLGIQETIIELELRHDNIAISPILSSDGNNIIKVVLRPRG